MGKSYLLTHALVQCNEAHARGWGWGEISLPGKEGGREAQPKPRGLDLEGPGVFSLE